MESYQRIGYIKMKYKVVTNELNWNASTYIVEADSEEEIKDMSYSDLQDYFYSEKPIGLEDYKIESIIPCL